MTNEAKKTTRTRAKKTAEAPKATTKQQQAAAPATPVKKMGRPKKVVEDAQPIGKQRQAAAAAGVGKQGASASGKTTKADASPAEAELRGGTKQVLITEAVITGRGGRPAGVEDYPFGELPPAYKDASGQIKGKSFFIPLTDRAEGKLAAARKRHRDEDGTPALFWSRKVFEQVNGEGPVVEGLRIWRGAARLKGEV